MTTLPPPCAIVMKSGNLNFLEPPGPLQAEKELKSVSYLLEIVVEF
jgi:hypothetical protein